MQHVAAGANRGEVLGRGSCGGWNVLELEGDNRNSASEPGDGIKVVIRSADFQIGHLPGGLSSSGGSPCTRYPSRRAAMANMRPSCPLPRTPRVEPGGMS